MLLSLTCSHQQSQLRASSQGANSQPRHQGAATRPEEPGCTSFPGHDGCAHARREEGQAKGRGSNMDTGGPATDLPPTLWHPAPWHLCPTLKWPLEAYDTGLSHCSNSNSSSSSRLSMQSREVPGLGKVPGKTRTCLSGCGGDTVWEALCAPKLGPTVLSVPSIPSPCGAPCILSRQAPQRLTHSSRPLFQGLAPMQGGCMQSRLGWGLQAQSWVPHSMHSGTDPPPWGPPYSCASSPGAAAVSPRAAAPPQPPGAAGTCGSSPRPRPQTC